MKDADKMCSFHNNTLLITNFNLVVRLILNSTSIIRKSISSMMKLFTAQRKCFSLKIIPNNSQNTALALMSIHLISIKSKSGKICQLLV